MQTFILASSILLWCVVLLNLLLTLALVRKVNQKNVPTMQAPTGLAPGDLAPAFSVQTSAGGYFSLDSILGQETVLFFTSPICGSCKKMLPRLRDLYPAIRRTGAQLFVVTDEREIDNARQLAAEFDLPPLLMAPRPESSFWQDYRIMGTPFYCHIDRQGKVLSSDYPSWEVGDWKDLVDTWESSPSTSASKPAVLATA